MGEPLGVEDDEIIHEHLKCLDMQLILEKIYKNRHVEIGRELRRQLANGNTYAWVVVHEGFVARKTMPKRRRRASDEMLLRCVVDSLFEE